MNDEPKCAEAPTYPLGRLPEHIHDSISSPAIRDAMLELMELDIARSYHAEQIRSKDDAQVCYEKAHQALGEQQSNTDAAVKEALDEH